MFTTMQLPSKLGLQKVKSFKTVLCEPEPEVLEVSTIVRRERVLKNQPEELFAF